MRWNVAQAKQSLSEVLRQANSEPQAIYNRERLVAAVVGGSLLEEFLRWRADHGTRTVGDAFADLRALCAEEDYELPMVERSTRPNPFAELLDEAS